MVRTKDRNPGVSDEEGVVLEGSVAASEVGEMRYDGTRFSFYDTIGEYDPRSGGSFPSATEVGQFLFSYNGSTFEIVKPVVADDGFIVTDDDGHIVVTP